VDATLPPESSDLSPLSASPQVLSGYRDRSTGLQVFGVIQIILGVLVALFIPMVLLGAVMSRKMTGTAMPMGTYLMTCLTYGALAIVLITLGIGSIRARRWAWALTLILSWFWLIIGVLATVLITAMLPSSFASGLSKAAAANPGAGGLPTGITAVILTFVIVLLAVFLVAIPLAFVLFYRRNDVETTCKGRDPVERWTDRCPLPVLAASLIFAGAASYYFFLSFTTPLVPFFGKYLTGVPGATGCLVLAAVDSFLAVWFFRVRLLGWWVGIVSLALRAISAAITFARGDLLQAYSRLGWKQAQLEMMSRSPVLRGHIVLWWSLVYLLVGLGYMVWIKRYFHAAPAGVGAQPIADPASRPDPRDPI
jgi:uncharacterized membrane protein